MTSTLELGLKPVVPFLILAPNFWEQVLLVLVLVPKSWGTEALTATSDAFGGNLKATFWLAS